MYKNKLLTIDFLRVLFAISVMIFHFNSWSHHDTNGLLNILSIYAVEGFFVISGIVLIYNYYDNFTLKKYFIHRFFRIAPLFYLTVILELIRHYNSTYFGYTDLNSLVFGVLSNISFFNIVLPYKASVVSSWSIMVEVGLYILFPLLLLMFKRYNLLNIFIFILSISFIIFLIFNFYFNDINLGIQNKYYTNVFFHLSFFLFGMLIGYLKLKQKDFLKIKYIFLILLILIFFLDINERKDLLLDQNRIILSAITILIIGYFTFNDFFEEKSKKIKKIVIFCSNLTYSIYLLHFFVFYIGYNIYKIQNIYLLMLIVPIISIPIYYFYERYFIKLGKNYA